MHIICLEANELRHETEQTLRVRGPLVVSMADKVTLWKSNTEI